uniref:PGG domain-containing protein n=1 Tax=Oryza barthii TaxID=65489 RepID=A0A0D3HK63_9ORYZ
MILQFCLEKIHKETHDPTVKKKLLTTVNVMNETPLLTAITSGHVTLAAFLLKYCHEQGFSEVILKQDKHKCNALHHAIRNGHKDLALELIATQPALSKDVNKYGESPMYIALMMRDSKFTDIFEKLLGIDGSSHSGTYGYNALHAAIRNGNPDIAKRIIVERPNLATEENKDGNTPIQLAVRWGKIDMLRVLLKHDRSQGYVINRKNGYPLLLSAAHRGHVAVAREIIKYCPDAPYCKKDGWTCLHKAVKSGNMEFVEFILGEPRLQKLVNMRSSKGKTGLHYAVQKCDPKIVAALLDKKIDLTILGSDGNAAAWELRDALDSAKTLNWNEVSMLMIKADPPNAKSVYNLHEEAKEKLINASRKDARSLTQTYTSNTSLVAILIATITFAAAFTLPGGYSSDAGSQGLPIMARNVAFKAFLISDTLAMCASLAVAFICIIARWEDLDFLLYYRSFTKKLMWFAYMATTTAFATGLYTVLAPRLLWLAVGICSVAVLMPILTKVLGEWPVLKLRIRLGQAFKSEFLDMDCPAGTAGPGRRASRRGELAPAVVAAGRGGAGEVGEKPALGAGAGAEKHYADPCFSIRVQRGWPQRRTQPQPAAELACRIHGGGVGWPVVRIADARTRGLLEAATSGDSRSLKNMVSQDPSMLLGTTPQGNTCLHISSIHGRESFCKDLMVLSPCLVAKVNLYGETPLLTAVTSGHDALASVLLRCCLELGQSEAILRQDRDGCNALHHAIRSGHKELALELIEAEPALSQGVNKHNESPMFIAAMRDLTDVLEKVLEIPNSSHVGACSYNALAAAVRNGNAAIAKKIVEARPWLAREENTKGTSPVHLTVLWDKADVLRVFLEHDQSLGYITTTNGTPLLNAAAYRGHIGAARELLKHCPDAPCCSANGWTCLHQAVHAGNTEFFEFIMRTPQLQRLVNMRDSSGKTALHYAVMKRNPKMVAALLSRKDVDYTMVDNSAQTASSHLWDAKDAKTLIWNEVSMLMLRADPEDATCLSNLLEEAKQKVTNESRKDVKSLTQSYTNNTSLVAILIATITFAAAFTLPGGYSSDDGHPIMARKLAFQAFLISDTLAMCSSLAVAFVCILSRSEDLEFLLYYRTITRNLMWLAYMATTTAFATGLYTVLAPRILWLAIGICFLSILLPVLTKLIGEWPVLKLRFRLGHAFKTKYLDIV